MQQQPMLQSQIAMGVHQPSSILQTTVPTMVVPQPMQQAIQQPIAMPMLQQQQFMNPPPPPPQQQQRQQQQQQQQQFGRTMNHHGMLRPNAF